MRPVLRCFRLRNLSGYSLIELLIVVALVGLLAAMAIPSYRDLLARSQIRSVATEVASELRRARQLAMARRERLRVRVDVAQQTLTLVAVDQGVALDLYRYGGKGVLLAEPSAGPDILFHPSGRTATATTIQIRHVRGLQTKLTVSLTGKVTMS